MCYEAKKNEKKLQHDEYEIISSEKNVAIVHFELV